MRIAISTTILMVYLLQSCSMKPEELEQNEAQILRGEWSERMDSTKIWVFKNDEVKWRGYHHFYKLKQDSLIISGIHYRIKSIQDDTIKLLDPLTKEITLIRSK